jgi:hypothetical protein
MKMSIRGSVAGLMLASSFLTAIPHASAATVPEPGVTGCDVLVTTLPGHNCLLPWPNDAFTKTAVVGDLAAGMMKNKGVAGFVEGFSGGGAARARSR